MNVSGTEGWNSPFDAGSQLGRSLANTRSRLVQCAASCTLDDFLERTVDEAELLTESTVGFFHCVDLDQLNLTRQNWSTRTKSRFCALAGKAMHEPVGSAGIWAEAVRTRVPVIHNEYVASTEGKGLPEGHVELVRELVFPIVRQGLVRAVLGVGNKPTDYGRADLEAVGQVADLAWEIAEERVAQAGLKADHERFRMIADNTYDWETWTAPDGTYLYVSPSCERISGRPAASFMVDPSLMTRIAHDDDRPRLLEHLRLGAAEGRAQDLKIEFRIIAADGTLRWIDHRCTPVYGEGGKWLGRRGSNRDVTEDRLTKERLAREWRLLAQVEAAAHVGSWRIGLGKREASPEIARILGCEDPMLDGDVIEAVRSVVHPDDRELFGYSRIRELLADGIRATDFRIVRPDGAVRWISAQGEVERGADGEPIAVSGILQDVTGRKDREESRARRVEQTANIDELTGLLNLRGFDIVADQAIAQAKRAKQGVGLLFCDIDGLKTINDELGHLEGDRALKDTATVLTSTLRSADAVARVGGDEFAVLAIGDDTEDVAYLRDRLQTGFELFNSTNERPYDLRVSTGGALCQAGEACRLDELRRLADSQMYGEKRRRQGGAR